MSGAKKNVFPNTHFVFRAFETLLWMTPVSYLCGLLRRGELRRPFQVDSASMRFYYGRERCLSFRGGTMRQKYVSEAQ